MVLETGPDSGWNYIHLTPGANPATGKAWVVGAQPQVTQALGTLATPLPNGFDVPHLHLDRGGAVDEYALGSHPVLAVRQMRVPVDDPLTALVPLVDTLQPVVDPELHFRIAGHEWDSASRPGNRIHADTGKSYTGGTLEIDSGLLEQARGDNHYFSSLKAVNGVNYVHLGALADTSAQDGSALDASANRSAIDIIANAWDRVGSVTTADKVGIKQIFFSITGTGAVAGVATGPIRPFDFTGKFLEDGVPDDQGKLLKHNYRALRDFDLVRIVYENDAVSDSQQRVAYWHTVTNTHNTADQFAHIGKDSKGQDNRTRYWASKVEQNGDWNDINDANEAKNNGQSRFKDGTYDVRVWARDAKGNQGETTRKVLLDNWKQGIAVPKGETGTGSPVRVEYGRDFLPDTSVSLFYRTSFPARGDSVGSFMSAAKTDSRGHFFDHPLSLPDGMWCLVADYDGDGVYTPELDGLSNLFYLFADGNLVLPVEDPPGGLVGPPEREEGGGSSGPGPGGDPPGGDLPGGPDSFGGSSQPEPRFTASPTASRPRITIAAAEFLFAPSIRVKAEDSSSPGHEEESDRVADTLAAWPEVINAS